MLIVSTEDSAMEEAIQNSSADDDDTEPTDKSPAAKKRKSRIAVIPQRSASSPQVKSRSASQNHTQNGQQHEEVSSTDQLIALEKVTTGGG